LKVSVITVCLNSAKTIGGTVESFLRQRHSDKELFVIDGGSTDETLKIVSSFGARGITVVSEPDDGLYDAANKGLALYTGDAVGLLNSDDRFASDDALNHIATGLSDCDIVFGDLDFVTNHDGGDVVRRWRGSPHSKGAFRRGWMPAHPTFYVRRKVIETLVGFDTRYRIAADYDFMLRALELTEYRSRFIDRVLVHMMHGGESTAGLTALVKHNYEALWSRQRWLDSGIVDYALFAKPMRKFTQLAMPSFKARQHSRATSSDGHGRVPAVVSRARKQHRPQGATDDR
jgi:glycosyltransferase involved in cell wall biosynthesis